MKKIYRITVDCANCANKMERAIQGLPGVKAASISFMAQKLMLEWEDHASEQELLQSITACCKKIERNARIEG